jgi:hypothetical protein
MKLGDICKVQSGLSSRQVLWHTQPGLLGFTQEQGQILEINTGMWQKEAVRLTKQDILHQEVVNSPEQYSVDAGDVLVLMTGTIKFGCVPEDVDHRNACVHQPINVLRFDCGELARSVSWWLNTPRGKHEVSVRTGISSDKRAGGQLYLTLRDLKKIPIPDNLDTANCLVDSLHKLITKEHERSLLITQEIKSYSQQVASKLETTFA